MGRAGPVVSVVTFYYFEDLSSNPAEISSLSVNLFCENEKEPPGIDVISK